VSELLSEHNDIVAEAGAHLHVILALTMCELGTHIVGYRVEATCGARE
jgi:hypothetical protein